MSMIKPATRPLLDAGRRSFMSGSGKAVLSATAVALLVGCESMAADKSKMAQAGMASDPEADAAILNVALGLEHQAIAAYQVGAESGLLKGKVLDTAVLFQSQHKEHRDALASTVAKLGAQPVQPLPMSDYAQSLDAGAIRTRADVLALAMRLEKEAANAYLGVIPSFTDDQLAQVAGRIAADETMHWTTLTVVTGEMLPQHALSFGG
ncbi:Rubrerythrin [Tistlia consotensis]|uniref:Rubrerythrin n=1 Tax=Tistlia consotensis USBA 355 TaxID=560819 RepID=A0A1Y6CLC6_9PROT|nr:ferritin-like domain-containing protein [Tistlia consotensis]SMF74132.1 Rubrerythrin [Tistlia consotensis USBA 355]SNS10230.1 Rubrerythrin [Tistlia consotensis]